MRRACLLAAMLGALTVSGQKSMKASSPDGSIQLSFKLIDGSPAYDLFFHGKPLIANSALGLNFKEASFEKNVKVQGPRFRDGVEEYQLIVGKSRHVRDPFREVVIPIQQRGAPHRRIEFVARVFNDGMAFRYEFPSQDGWTSYTLIDEHSAFSVHGNPKVLALILPNYTTSHEGEYTSARLNDMKAGMLMDIPALFEFPGVGFLAITEAALRDYPGMYLLTTERGIRGRLSPLPAEPGLTAKGTMPHRTPWRVLMVGDRVGSLIESDILTSLNEDCEIDDTSWIKPGKTTWPWWNGNVVPDTTFAPGNNFETNQYYIDFCARNGLEYHSVVEYGQHEWYVNDGVNFQPGPHADVTKPVPGLDMKRICDYARQKNVGIRVWVHWAALYPKLDEALAQYAAWGVSGMMVDFMDRDDQEMVNIQEEILRKSATHRLHVQFHGAYKPTGMSRTYPNEFTREGVLNYEYNKWGKVLPDHDIRVPFTRMLAGPTDYHLGGFRAIPEQQHKIQYIRPLVVGTRAHMLAMYVVLESYLGLVCDFPAAYEGEPGFDFLRKVPTTWDETRVVDAVVDDYIVIARRKGTDWYVGAITDSTPRTLTVDFTFLGEGEYESEIFTDGVDTVKDPNYLDVQTRTMTKSSTVRLILASGGGAAIHLERK